MRREIQFVFSVNSIKDKDEEVRFINSVIKKTAERNKIRVSFTRGSIISADSVFNSVYVDIIELKTSYPGFADKKFLGKKLVHRNLTALINLAIHGNKYDFISIDTINVSFKDRVELSEVEGLETEDYSFTHSSAPKVSLYEEIVFPVALILVSVTAAILFFTIRSK